MPRSCTVCQHAQRRAIDRALAAGEPFRAIARRYATSKDALRRHAEGHLPAAILKAQGAAEVAHGDELFDQVRGQQQRAETLYREAAAILKQARRRKEGGLALEAIRTAATTLREARRQIELLAHLVESREAAELERKIADLEQRLGNMGRPYGPA